MPWPWKADFSVLTDFSTDKTWQGPNVVALENRPTTESGAVINEGWNPNKKLGRPGTFSEDSLAKRRY